MFDRIRERAEDVAEIGALALFVGVMGVAGVRVAEADEYCPSPAEVTIAQAEGMGQVMAPTAAAALECRYANDVAMGIAAVVVPVITPPWSNPK